MIYVVSALLIVAVAMIVAAPFLAPEAASMGRDDDSEQERLEREKAAALLAIREAQLDKAMGKLSDEDYTALRAFYERRAISAMAGLDGVAESRATTRASDERCVDCGSLVASDSEVCGRCGAPSARVSL